MLLLCWRPFNYFPPHWLESLSPRTAFQVASYLAWLPLESPFLSPLSSNRWCLWMAHVASCSCYSLFTNTRMASLVPLFLSGLLSNRPVFPDHRVEAASISLLTVSLPISTQADLKSRLNLFKEQIKSSFPFLQTLPGHPRASHILPLLNPCSHWW